MTARADGGRPWKISDVDSDPTENSLFLSNAFETFLGSRRAREMWQWRHFGSIGQHITLVLTPSLRPRHSDNSGMRS